MRFCLVFILTLIFTSNPAKAGETKEPLLWKEMQAAILQTEDIERVKELLAAGADINGPIGCGDYNSLDGAVQKGNAEMVKFLIKNGAKPKGRALSQAAFGLRNPWTIEIVNTLIHAGADVNYKDKDSRSMALHHACFQANPEVVKLLLDQPKIELDPIDIDGRTPLMWAVEKGSTEIVKMLLDAGAQPAIKNKRGEDSIAAALHQIAKDQDILKMLRSKKHDVH